MPGEVLLPSWNGDGCRPTAVRRWDNLRYLYLRLLPLPVIIVLTHVYFDHLCNAVQITSMLDSLFLVYKYLRLLDHGSQLQLSDHVKM